MRDFTTGVKPFGALGVAVRAAIIAGLWALLAARPLRRGRRHHQPDINYDRGHRRLPVGRPGRPPAALKLPLAPAFPGQQQAETDHEEGCGQARISRLGVPQLAIAA